MPATIPDQGDLDVIKLAFEDHLKLVDAKLLEYDGLPEREKHDFAELERRLKIVEDKLELSEKPDPVQPAPEPYPLPPDQPRIMRDEEDEEDLSKTSYPKAKKHK